MTQAITYQAFNTFLNQTVQGDLFKESTQKNKEVVYKVMLNLASRIQDGPARAQAFSGIGESIMSKCNLVKGNADPLVWKAFSAASEVKGTSAPINGLITYAEKW